MLAGGLLVGAVFLGAVQGHVPHAVHRVRPVSAAIVDGHVADDALHDQRCYVLRNVSGARHQSHSEPRLITKTIQREGYSVHVFSQPQIPPPVWVVSNLQAISD